MVPPLFCAEVGVKTRVNRDLGQGHKKSGRSQVWVNSTDLLRARGPEDKPLFRSLVVARLPHLPELRHHVNDPSARCGEAAGAIAFRHIKH